jgi:hypothetical protein
VWHASVTATAIVKARLPIGADRQAAPFRGAAKRITPPPKIGDSSFQRYENRQRSLTLEVIANVGLWTAGQEAVNLAYLILRAVKEHR